MQDSRKNLATFTSDMLNSPLKKKFDSSDTVELTPGGIKVTRGHPARVIAGRLYGWARYNRGTSASYLNDLRNGTTTSRARGALADELPDGWEEAATLTGILYARWHAGGRFPKSGWAPLPRVLRGTRNLPGGAAMTGALKLLIDPKWTADTAAELELLTTITLGIRKLDRAPNWEQLALDLHQRRSSSLATAWRAAFDTSREWRNIWIKLRLDTIDRKDDEE